MSHHQPGISCRWISAMLAAVLSLASFHLPADNGLQEALVNGKFGLNLRYRFEHVDDDFRPAGQPLKHANASTLRTAISYNSGTWHGLSALLELEQVSRFFGGDFNEGVGRPSRFATVVDPDGTELNQGYLQYRAPADSTLRFGRQIITYRDAPFHRFIGTILWRQNWQTFDAVSLENTYFPDTTISYAWVWNVNRIFGTSAVEPLSNFDSDSHFINIKYKRFQWAQIEAYSYLLDFDKAPRFSSRTTGIRINGEYPLSKLLHPLYAVEYADQRDYAGNATNYDAAYQLLEAGIKLNPPRLLDSVVLKFRRKRMRNSILELS